MDSSSNDLGLLLISHYLQERGFNETARILERESRIIFNLDYFASQIREGMFDIADEYLSAFTKPSDNWMSARAIYLVKQLKLLEAVYDGCKTYAQSIVEREFTQFETIIPQITEEAIKLVEMTNPRSHPMLQNFHREHMRMRVAEEVKEIIRMNPVFSGKLEYPPFEVTLQRLFNMAETSIGPNARVINLFRNRYARAGRNNSGN
ncbi:hypothetical protein Lal_00004743 [Lupinus albus]|uniref:Putative transcription factor interactor and regulator LisH family n=1 Tax=Lupinus albus TaxID=3870 RepID=A0A6A4N6Q8_LUPAL|nr:putative transcription factor interactor and regulator LisH family [Lupinus albus]KAF1865369.1 hypothetical protein Lal_00004743 [Lupinus albus]